MRKKVKVIAHSVKSQWTTLYATILRFQDSANPLFSLSFEST